MTLAVLLLIGVPCFSHAADSGKLSVQGSATLYVEPDFVTVTLSVIHQADRATDANQEVTETMKELLEVACRQNIEDVDLETNGIQGRRESEQ